MYRALWSWIICVVVTVVVSYMTKPKPETELVGLVYGCTEIPVRGTPVPFYQRPDVLGRRGRRGFRDFQYSGLVGVICKNQ